MRRERLTEAVSLGVEVLAESLGQVPTDLLLERQLEARPAREALIPTAPRGEDLIRLDLLAVLIDRLGRRRDQLERQPAQGDGVGNLALGPLRRQKPVVGLVGGR